MDNINDAIFLTKLFPENYLKITGIDQQENQICIHAKSITTKCRCPMCGTWSTAYHGTYTRRVQDLPILGKNVRLEIKAREYRCANEDCDTATIAESFDGFLDPYSGSSANLRFRVVGSFSRAGKSKVIMSGIQNNTDFFGRTHTAV